MTAISGSITLSNLTPVRVDPSQLKPVSELPEKAFQDFMQRNQTFLESRHSNMQPGDSRLSETYAEVIVNGRVVATLDNNGYLQTANGFYSQSGIEPGNAGLNPHNVPKGPALAQARAEYLAELTGGTVLVHNTALNQATYEGLEQPKVVVDQMALSQDPWNLNLLKIQQARHEFLQQQAESAQASLLDT